LFHIVSEGSVASGVRRIEAVTGPAAYSELESAVEKLERVAGRLKSTRGQVEQKLDALLAQLDAKDKEIARLHREMAKRQAEDIDSMVRQVDGVRVLTHIVDAPSQEHLREQSDYFKNKLGSGIVALGAVINDKPSLLVAVTADLVARGFDAQKIVRASAPVMGGGGGGKSSLAQAGGKDPSKLQDALDEVVRVVNAK
jgi:alanyl-tRNA synthetase